MGGLKDEEESVDYKIFYQTVQAKNITEKNVILKKSVVKKTKKQPSQNLFRTFEKVGR